MEWMSDDDTEDEIVRSARITRHRDATPLGCSIHLTGSDLLQLGIDPVETDVVDIVIHDGELRLSPGKGEPVILEHGASSHQRDQWQETGSETD